MTPPQVVGEGPHSENIPSELEGVIEDDLRVGEYLNPFGEVRLENIRGQLDLNNPHDREIIIDLYERWVKHDEYVVVKRTETLRGFKKRQWLSIKASKKGNDVYAYNLDKKMKTVQDNFEKIILSDTVYTNALYITFTYNPKIEPDRNKAWLSVGKEFNKFMSSLKKTYGNVVFLRSWEAFRNGYPHIHGLLVFLEHKFEYFEHVDSKGYKSKRILKKDRPEDEDKDKDKIAKMWHSFIDVVAIGGNRYEIKRAVKDVMFYVQKSVMKKPIPTENPQENLCRFCTKYPCGVWEDWNEDYSKVIKRTPTTEPDDKACSDFEDKRKFKISRGPYDTEKMDRCLYGNASSHAVNILGDVITYYEAIECDNDSQDDKDNRDYEECEQWPYKRILTNAIIWYLGLRSYAVSRTILPNREDIEGLAADLRTASGVIQTVQTDLDGDIGLKGEWTGNKAGVEYTFIGMIAGNRIGMKGEWTKIYKEEPEWIREVFIPKKMSGRGIFGGLAEAFR